MKSIFAFSVLFLLLTAAPAQASDFNIVLGYSRQGPARCQTHGYQHQKGDCHGKEKTVYFEAKSLPYFLSRVFYRKPYHYYDNYYYTRSGHSYYPYSQYYCKKHHRYHTYNHGHDKHSKKNHYNDCGKSHYGHNEKSHYGQHKKHSYYK